jgi:hypothetical protein
MLPKNAWEEQEAPLVFGFIQRDLTATIKIGTKRSEIQIKFCSHQLINAHTPTPMKI